MRLASLVCLARLVRLGLVVHGVLGVLCVLSALGMRPDSRVEVWLVANSVSGLQPTVSDAANSLPHNKAV